MSLWYSYGVQPLSLSVHCITPAIGTMTLFLGEIIAVYPFLNTDKLSVRSDFMTARANASQHRSLPPPSVCATCSACCSASHHTRRHAIFSSPVSHVLPCMCVTDCIGTAHLPQYFYPFLNSVTGTEPFEYLRLTSLGVIGTLVKVHACVHDHDHVMVCGRGRTARWSSTCCPRR